MTHRKYVMDYARLSLRKMKGIGNDVVEHILSFVDYIGYRISYNDSSEQTIKIPVFSLPGFGLSPTYLCNYTIDNNANLWYSEWDSVSACTFRRNILGQSQQISRGLVSRDRTLIHDGKTIYIKPRDLCGFDIIYKDEQSTIDKEGDSALFDPFIENDELFIISIPFEIKYKYDYETKKVTSQPYQFYSADVSLMTLFGDRRYIPYGEDGKYPGKKFSLQFVKDIRGNSHANISVIDAKTNLPLIEINIPVGGRTSIIYDRNIVDINMTDHTYRVINVPNVIKQLLRNLDKKSE